jgi:hypothetical protein
MKVIDIWFGNLWNLDRPHFVLLSWDVNTYYDIDEIVKIVHKRCGIEIILCSFKILITIELH